MNGVGMATSSPRRASSAFSVGARAPEWNRRSSGSSGTPPEISIFVRPASLEELERRLRGRGTESEETIQRRLEVARREWQFKDQYRIDLVNQQVDETAWEMCLALRGTLSDTE